MMHPSLLGSRGAVAQFFRDVVLQYDGTECLVWPFARKGNGYGQIKFEGKNRSVHRLVCEKSYGMPPSQDYEAAHSCGNGHLGCVAKRHLSWKTPLGNSADKFRHGTVLRGEDNPSSKLTVDQVLEIKSLIGVDQQKDIARKFNVSPAAIRKIAAGKLWGWLTINNGRIP